MLKEWLDYQPFQEILEENSLTEEDVIRILWKAGHIELPMWLEDKLQYEEDNEDDE